MSDWREEYLTDVRREFAAQRGLAERAIEQIDEDALFRTTGADDNSIAVLMKHIGGNLASRWTDPFTTDGEKPDRNRDREFEVGPGDVADVRRLWHTGWTVLETTLASFTAADLDGTLRIRGEELSLVTAVNRSLAHTAQHVGQIILLARLWCGAEWQTLSIPRGRSEGWVPPGRGGA